MRCTILYTDFERLQAHSNHVFTFWQSGAWGWAPPDASKKLEVAKLDWMMDLTNSLVIWLDKNIDMTNGELILAYANLGALVEGWLKLFYCVYYLDYEKAPVENRNGIIEPNDLKFEQLKQFSVGKLWENNSEWSLWIDKIQRRRNAIHSFNSRDIGDPYDFLNDIDLFSLFVSLVDERLPYPDYFDTFRN